VVGFAAAAGTAPLTWDKLDFDTWRIQPGRAILKEDDFEVLDNLRDHAGKVTWGLCASMSSARSR
jgi:hypothetical protein